MENVSRAEPNKPERNLPAVEDITPGSLDIRQILRIIQRRKWILVTSVLLFALVAAINVSQQTPIYTTSAALILNTRESNVVDVQAVLSGLPADETAVMGEIEIIYSSQLIGRVVDKLRLEHDPEFNGALRTPKWSDGLFSISTYVPNDLLVQMGLRPAPMPAASSQSTAVELQDQIRSGVIAEVQARMTVEPVNYSLVIQVSFKSEDPRKAALIANTIIEQYMVDQLEAKFDAADRASLWLNDRLSELKAEVEASEAAVETYRATLSAGSAQNTDLITQQMSQISSELTIASTQRAEAQARYNQVNNLINSGGTTAAADFIASPMIQSLRQLQADLSQEETQLSIEYGDLHPVMIDIRAKIEDTTRQIDIEVGNVVANLSTELAVARSREAALRQSLDALEQQSSNQSQASVELRQLEREAEASRAVYENFLSRFKETEQQDDLQEADARMISRAEVPGAPSSPNKRRAIMVAVFLGLFAGMAIIYLLEKLDNAYRSPEQIERDLGLATLTMVPFTKQGKQRRDVLRSVLKEPASSLAEAFRSLRNTLFLTNVDTPPKVVLVTSSVPREGKSTTAVLLALATARVGKKVVVVDCDLRRPTLHSTLKIDSGSNLVDYLSHSASLEEVITHDEETGIDVIPSSATSASASDLLSTQTFRNLLEELRERYDMVIVDAAPILAVSDALVIGPNVDSIIYVSRWDHTPRSAVRSGVQSLRDAGLHVSGLVFCLVDLKRHASYGYDDYASHYGRYKEYYES